MPLRTPRRPPVRPHSEPVERNEIVDAAAPRETAFVPALVAEEARDWTQPYAPPARKKGKTYMVTTAPEPVRPETDEDRMLKAMTDQEFDEWVEREHGFQPSHFMAQAYRDSRK